MLTRRAQTDRQSKGTGGFARAFSCNLPASTVEEFPRQPRPANRRSGRALAALEAVLLLVIVAAGLALLAGQSEAARDRLRQDLASRQLAVLGEALTVYYLDTGTFPPGRPDFSAGEAFNGLRAVPACGAVLTDWPGVAGAPAAEPRDPWRSAYRYLAADNDRSPQVAGNGGWPIFLSAGPDGSFGDPAAPSTEVDNRRTDELFAQ